MAPVLAGLILILCLLPQTELPLRFPIFPFE